MTDGTSSRGVLEGAFALLEHLPDTQPPHQLRDLALLSGVPRSSVYRLLDQLRAIGAVELVGDRFVLGRAMLTMGARVEPATGLRRDTGRMLQALREQTGATVSLIASAESSATVIESIPGRDTLPVDIFAGRLLPVHAAGSLVIEPSAAPERVNAARRAAVDDGDVVSGLSCFAVAIPLPDGSAAALQLSTLPEDPAIRYSSVTQQVAARIREHLRADALSQ
ncbi:helix-turn-helix domain-containing protein [Subtercola lobariae]|uniref:HTH iclR-type domain-containing protein n=1 Tax=Subtercola lobariae TaxID=1588641 RepID=A0A917BBP4_9MICO|nr:helix-turn-helix domain-containing protein [Subtercola lobariae]GGF32876.1 hypothetical protein GCM10011399_27510 [Subtercola lobariae]